MSEQQELALKTQKEDEEQQEQRRLIDQGYSVEPMSPEVEWFSDRHVDLGYKNLMPKRHLSPSRDHRKLYENVLATELQEGLDDDVDNEPQPAVDPLSWHGAPAPWRSPELTPLRANELHARIMDMSAEGEAAELT